MIVLYVLYGLALIVIMTAGFNYTNLTIALALMRSREVGIRKVVGARRRQVFAQFIGEAVLMSLISLILAYIVYRGWLVPSFLNFHPTFRQFFTFKENILFILYFLVFAILTGITAGCLPALYMSRFEPLKVLKGFQSIRLFSRITLRKVLIVCQFSFSLVFITMTVVSFMQVRYVRRMNKGFQADSIVNIEIRGVDYSLFRQRVSQNASITGVSACDYLPGTSSTFYMRIRKNISGDSLYVNALSTDEHFIDNLHMTMVAGQDFLSSSADLTTSIVINEYLAERIGWEHAPDAVGETIYYTDGTPVQIIGVVGDFSQSSLYDRLEPCLIRFVPENWQQINVRLSPMDLIQTLVYMEKIWKELYPDTPFKYAFYQDQIEEDIIGMYLMMKSIRFIAILMILVSCMGLYGIVDYHSRTKVKEIGIRKVLGAGEGQLIRLLSGEFFRILLIAVMIAVPLSHLLNQLYLRLYERHVPLQVAFYLSGIFLLFLFGMFGVLNRTVRASRVNPVECLRYE